MKKLNVEELKKLRNLVASVSSTITAGSRNESGLVQKDNLLNISEETLKRQLQELEDLKEKVGDKEKGMVMYLNSVSLIQPNLEGDNRE